MKISELFEGKFVEPFNKNGKPNPNHPAYAKNKAVYDAEQKATKVVKVKETAAEKAKKLDNALHTCSNAFMVDGWGELDSSDLVRMKIIPAIKKRIKADPDKYSDDFKDAVQKTGGEWGNYDALYKYFDQAAKKYEKVKDFNAYVDQVEADYKELMKNESVQESVESKDISIANNDFEKINVTDIEQDDLPRYVKVAQAKRDSLERRAAKSISRPKVGTTPTNSEVEGAKSFDARIRSLDSKIAAAKKKM